MDLTKIAVGYYDEILFLIKEMCVIPSPSGFEDKRADFVLNYFKSLGVDNAHIDEAKNVVCTIGEESEKLILFMAHTDIVFPFETPLEIKEDEEALHCPGVGDDTACLAAMMVAVKHIVTKGIKLKRQLLIVANSCEEGLGNLKGCRRIFKDYEGRIERMYTFDGAYTHIVKKSVGSHRYEIIAKTEGGHSFEDFGNHNAIDVLAEIIHKLYEIKVPEFNGSKTTYNVGMISGGTSVNTIAQEAEMLVEYRSDNLDCLNVMKEKLYAILEEERKNCKELSVRLVGDRPCTSSDMDFEELQRAFEAVKRIQMQYSGLEVIEKSGSTDANIPHSLGIPAICVGNSLWNNIHTTEEYILKKGIVPGFAITLHLILEEGKAE